MGSASSDRTPGTKSVLITLSEGGERCCPCFNDETAARLGVAFDNAALQPIVLVEPDGVPRRFEIRSMLVPTGHEMIAHEVPYRAGGYRFAVLGDFEADASRLFKRLHEKMRAEMSVRHVELTDHGWHLAADEELIGRIEYDEGTNGETPLLVVDGKALSWNEVGRMLMTYEGFTLRARVEDSIDVVGGPLAAPRSGRRRERK